MQVKGQDAHFLRRTWLSISTDKYAVF